MAYLLDANVFIEAPKRHYGFDFCPAFWDWLAKRNAAGIVFSSEKVGDEIEAGDDELRDWARKRGTGFFLKIQAATLPSLQAVSHWATSQNYEPVAVSDFLSKADYYLIAQALADGYTVVTHEISSTSQKKIKIPDACVGLGAKFMTPYQMLRIERARFVLGTAQ